MSINARINDPIFKKDGFHIDPCGELSIDILRIQKVKDQSSKESAAYKIFRDIYAEKCNTPKNLVDLFDKLLIFFEERSDPENGWLDMYKRVFFGYLSYFKKIPENIKERVREEYSKMKETYEMSKAVLIVEEIMAKPEK